MISVALPVDSPTVTHKFQAGITGRLICALDDGQALVLWDGSQNPNVEWLDELNLNAAD
jgi:hypothetical protein